MGHGLARQKPAEDGEGVVHAPAPGGGIDAATLDLVAILAPHAHAEHEAAGRQVGEVGDLAGDGHRVSQGEEVDGEVDGETGFESGEDGGADHAVEADAAEERHVVACADVIEAGSGGGVKVGGGGPDVGAQERWEDPHGGYRHGRHRRGRPGPAERRQRSEKKTVLVSV